MTSAKPVLTTLHPTGPLVFPNPPEDPDDKMTNFNKMARTGNVHYLAQHLGHPDTTLVAGEHYVSPQFTSTMAGLRYPDLLVAFGVDPAAYYQSNAYVISEQGKPPDFVLEIASESTWREDAGPKRDAYAALGVGEYWRFDETGRFGGRLSGERLVGGVYVAIEIEELADGSLQGYSAALDLHLTWVQGELVFCDPATGRRIITLEDERARAEAERTARIAAEAELAAERVRVRELEERLRRQNS